MSIKWCATESFACYQDGKYPMNEFCIVVSSCEILVKRVDEKVRKI